jgi:hypothetical protein
MPQATTNYPSKVVNGKRRSNNGWHTKGKRAYRNAERTIINCLQYYREPRLYHVVFSGGSHQEHLGMRVALCQRLTRKKLPHEWFSARERSVEKGNHLHVFFLVDSSATRAQAVLNTYDDCWLALECHKRNLRKPWINGPRDEGIHGDNQHGALPYLGPNNRATPLGIERLVDALEWMSYIYKARDKHDEEWEGQGQIFPASRPQRSKQMVDPTDKRQQANGGLALKIKTGDNLLDQLIAETLTASSARQ